MSIAVCRWKKKKKKKGNVFRRIQRQRVITSSIITYYTDATDAHVKRLFLYYSSTVNYSDYLCTRLINRETGRRSDKVGKEKSLLYISKGGIIYALWKRRIDSLELILNLENKIKSGGVAR